VAGVATAPFLFADQAQLPGAGDALLAGVEDVPDAAAGAAFGAAAFPAGLLAGGAKPA
jgi:hypothetical protein